MIKQQLEKLNLREKALVKSIRDDIKKEDSNCEIVYLPNLMPRKKVEYIFITMEPSFGRWAKNEKDAKQNIENGFRNFILSWEDFIFHFCITNYLSPSYFVTDISKAAMKVKYANNWRNDIYPKWIKPLKKEIEIVGQNDCKLILVGKCAKKFFSEQKELKELNRKVSKSVLHFSGQAGKGRKEVPQKYPKEFKHFKKNIESSDVILFAKNFLKQNSIPTEMREWILKKLENNKTKLSESRKELIFTYYREFQEISQIA